MLPSQAPVNSPQTRMHTHTHTRTPGNGENTGDTGQKQLGTVLYWSGISPLMHLLSEYIQVLAAVLPTLLLTPPGRQWTCDSLDKKNWQP